MSRSGIVLMLSLLWVSTCSHTQELEEPDEKKAEDPQKTRAEKKERKARESEVKRPAYRGRPELSTNATGLMLPGGPAKIQRALAKAGYYQGAFNGELDDETAAALRKFQGANELAKTGAPDEETVKALGLDPDDVWRPQGEKQETGAP
jgi:hypothetical protein